MPRNSMSAAINAVRLIKQKTRKAVTAAFSEKYLFFTNVSVGTGLSAVGDAIEQCIEITRNDLDKFDFRRNFNMTITGLPMGIICHNWYKFLDKRLPGDTIQLALKKVVLDQFICSPLCISSLFVTLAILEGNTYQQVLDEIYDKAWKLYVAEWVIWPPAQFINFYILPLRFRFLFDSTISLGYDIYTSYVRHQNHPKKCDVVPVKDINKKYIEDDFREEI